MDVPYLVWIAILLLLILAAGLGLWRLRAGGPELARRRNGVLTRVRQDGREFSSLARRMPANPGEPYASRLARAGQALRQGWDRARRVEANLTQAPTDPAPRPFWQLLLLAPLFIELTLRLGLWIELFWLEGQTRKAENELGEARSRLEEAGGLGKQEQTSLNQLRETGQALLKELDEHRLAPAMTGEREKLGTALERLEQAAGQLGTDEPAPTQVVEIYPLRVQTEKEIATIRQAIRSHEASHERLRPRLERQIKRQEAFEQALAAEEANCAAPKLHEQTAAARQACQTLEEKLNHGGYAAIEAGLAELAGRQKELEETLKKLAGLRARLSAARNQTGAALAELRQWMRQYPAPFVLDVAQEQAKTLQAKLQEQARAAGSEDPAVLEAAANPSLDEIRKSISAFERSLEIYQRVAPQLSPEAVDGMQKRGEHLAARLKQRHAVFQQKARLAGMEDHLARLAEGWKAIQGADPNRQSELTRLGPALQQMESAWGELERDTQRAMTTLEQAKALQDRSLLRLEDPSFNEVAALAQMEGGEWTGTARQLLDRRQPLLERAQRGDEDFNAVSAEAESLQKEAAKLYKEYQFRLARVQIELNRLIETLNGLADRLDRLENHPYLDFADRAGATLPNLRRWLGGAQTPAAAGPERITTLVEQGSQLRMEAEALCRGMETETATADQERAWTVDMLATAEEYLGGARAQQPPNSFSGELAAARNVLETARRKLDALAAPRRKYILQEYLAELNDVRQMISSGRAHVDNVLGG